MKVRHVLGSLLLATGALVLVPTFLSAQGEVVDAQPGVRITLLESGDILVTGDFLLEVPNGEAYVLAHDMSFSADGDRLVTMRNGVSVQVRGFVVEADSGSFVTGERSDPRNVRMQDARISRLQ
jgi:hypothetical protein